MGNYFCQCTNQQNSSFLSPQKLHIYQKFLRQYSDIYSPEVLITDDANVTSNISKLTNINFQPQKFLGTGFFGNVVAVKKIDPQNQKLFALKIIDKNAIKEKILLHSQTFQNIVSKNNPFLIQIHQVFQNQKKIFILMQHIPAGDLLFYIQKSKGFDEDTIKQVAAQIIYGLECLHQQGIICRVLKPQNVMVCSNGHIKLTDYWSSKKLIESNRPQKFSGTVQYTAPQILKNQNYNQTSDIWSFGMLLFQMKYGKVSFDQHNDFKQNLINSKFQELYQTDQRCSNQIKDLLTKLLSSEPSYRPTIQQIKNHPFFSGINWNLVSQRQNQSPLQKLIKKHNTRQQRSSYVKPQRLSKMSQHICFDAIYQFNHFQSN